MRTVMRRRWVGCPCLAALLALVTGCASEGVRYAADKEVVRTQAFNAKDLQDNVKLGVKKLVAKAERTLGAAAFAGQPRMFVAPVENKTDEHIDPSIIQEYLESEITDQASVILLDRGKAMELVKKELRLQQGDLFDPDKAVEVGKFLGAQYLLYGSLNSLRAVTRSRRAESQLYFFSLSLVSVKTGRKIPVKHQIQKVARKGILGW